MAQAVFVGGSNGSTIYTSDVYVTQDNITFTKQTVNFPETANDVALVRFNGAFYAIGGYTGTTRLAKVYKSTDLSSWTLLTSSPGWVARSNPSVFVFQNKLWLIGGTTQNSGATGDVWNSSDGITWTKVGTVDSSITTGYFECPVLVHPTLGLFIFGGRQTSSTGTGTKNCYSSTDGITWTKTTAPWAARLGHLVYFYNNTMYVVGGSAIANTEITWSTSDGTNWTNISSGSNLGTLMGQYNVVYGLGGILNNKAIYFGTTNYNNYPPTKTFSTTNFQTWSADTTSAPAEIYSRGHAVLAINTDVLTATVQTSASSTSSMTFSIQAATIQNINASANSTSSGNCSITAITVLNLQASAASTSNVNMVINLNYVSTRGSASSTSSGSITLTVGQIQYINLIKGSSTSTATLNSLQMGQIQWLQGITISSTSTTKIVSIYAGNPLTVNMVANAQSNVNALIGFADITTYILKGLVTSGGSPAAYATVKAVNKNNDKYIYTTTTDTNGNYSLICNMAGEYVVVCYSDASGKLQTSKAKSFVRIGGG